MTDSSPDQSPADEPEILIPKVTLLALTTAARECDRLIRELASCQSERDERNTLLQDIGNVMRSTTPIHLLAEIPAAVAGLQRELADAKAIIECRGGDCPRVQTIARLEGELREAKARIEMLDDQTDGEHEMNEVQIRENQKLTDELEAARAQAGHVTKYIEGRGGPTFLAAVSRFDTHFGAWLTALQPAAKADPEPPAQPGGKEDPPAAWKRYLHVLRETLINELSVLTDWGRERATTFVDACGLSATGQALWNDATKPNPTSAPVRCDKPVREGARSYFCDKRSGHEGDCGADFANRRETSATGGRCDRCKHDAHEGRECHAHVGVQFSGQRCACQGTSSKAMSADPSPMSTRKGDLASPGAKTPAAEKPVHGEGSAGTIPTQGQPSERLTRYQIDMLRLVLAAQNGLRIDAPLARKLLSAAERDLTREESPRPAVVAGIMSTMAVADALGWDKEAWTDEAVLAGVRAARAEADMFRRKSEEGAKAPSRVDELLGMAEKHNEQALDGHTSLNTKLLSETIGLILQALRADREGR